MPDNADVANSAVGRADRILDAAGALLVRLGYRKVAVADIARAAGIGKGTIYLHWRTKEQLFLALLRRESVVVIREVIAHLRADPTEVRPHRLVRTLFLAVARNRLLRAVVVGDTELLGKWRDNPARAQELLATERFLDLMTQHGLLRGDVPNPVYALRATALGHHLPAEFVVPGEELDRTARADTLAFLIRHAFEPAKAPTPAAMAAAAAELCAIYEDLIANYQKWIYGGVS